MGTAEANKDNAQALWEEYSKNPSNELKNELVVHYLYLVKRIVFRMLPTYEGYSSYDDLTSCGVLGLIDAIDKFDYKRQVKFEHYASMRIRGEIIDQIRKQDWAPYSLRRKIKSITNAYSDMEMQLGREPSDVEVSKYLDMDLGDIQETMKKSHMFNVLHFEDMMNEFQTWGDIAVDSGEGPEEQMTNKEVIRVLGDLIDSLPKRERTIITLYYYEDLTLREIAKVLEMSESRISQILSKLIESLKTRMGLLLNR